MNNQPFPGTTPTPQPSQTSDIPAQITPQNQPAQPVQQPTRTYETIFCSTCGKQIAKAALACPFCGTPVYQNQPQQSQQPPQIIINNSNSNINSNVNENTLRAGNNYYGRPRNKWVAFFLCLFLGYLGAHKFYEGKVKMGVLYLVTFGLFFIGAAIDLFKILFKPNPYYV